MRSDRWLIGSIGKTQLRRSTDGVKLDSASHRDSVRPPGGSKVAASGKRRCFTRSN